MPPGDFTASASWDGARTGKVFGCGGNGVGYYVDSAPEMSAEVLLLVPDVAAQKRYELDMSDRQACIVAFYAKHDSSKTEADISGLITKPRYADNFGALCAALDKKYKENPIEMWEANMAVPGSTTTARAPAPAATPSAEAMGEGGLGEGYDAGYCVVPDTEDAQLKLLTAFYAKFDASKKEADCKKILDKRKGDKAVLSTLKFSNLCASLEKKYGSNPMDTGTGNDASRPAAPAAAPAAAVPAPAPAPAPAPTSGGWAAKKASQSSSVGTWTCGVCMVKNSLEAKMCVACESPQPGCEEEAKQAKEDARKAKEAEMQAKIQEQAKSVAAAGISFGLPKAGGAAPAFSFAPKASSSSTASTKPAFSFSPSPALKAPSTTSAFSFGAKPAPTLSFDAAKPSSSSGFSFGAAQPAPALAPAPAPVPTGPAVMLDEDALDQAETDLSFGLIESHVRFCAQGGHGIDEDVAEAALDAVLRLSSAHGAAMGKVGMCSAVVSMMRAFADEAAVVEVGLGCIDRLSRKGNQDELGPLVAALLVKAMDEHKEGEPTLQETACLVAEGLAQGHKANAQLLVKAGIESRLVHAEGNIENERNVVYPSNARKAIEAALGTPISEGADASEEEEEEEDSSSDGEGWVTDEAVDSSEDAELVSAASAAASSQPGNQSAGDTVTLSPTRRVCGGCFARVGVDFAVVSASFFGFYCGVFVRSGCAACVSHAIVEAGQHRRV